MEICNECVQEAELGFLGTCLECAVRLGIDFMPDDDEDQPELV